MKKTLWAMAMASLTWAAQPKLDPLHFKISGLSANGDSVKVKVEIPKGWHLTSNAPKSEFQIPMETQLSGLGLAFGTPVYPAPVITPMPALGFDGSWFVDSMEVKFPIIKSTTPTWPSIKVSMYFQACTDAFCIAPRTDSAEWSIAEIEKFAAHAPAAVQTSDRELPKSPTSSEIQTPKQESQSLWLYLVLAFLGGMILNLMPCVLPVLGLKVFSLMNHGKEGPKSLMGQGLAFLAGTLSSFLALATVMVVLKSGGRAIGWGFQFQEPGFVLFMALVVGVFALNLLGLFEVSLGWKTQTALDKASRKSGLAGAFWGGAFMTLLATPCTAPMLSPAMAFAFSQSTWVLYVFMGVVALGLAFPYTLVCMVPAARRYFPKPGDWMVRLKELMGYMMLLTLIWLLYTFGQMAGNYALSLLLTMMVIFAMGLWLFRILPWCSPLAEKSAPRVLTAWIMVIVWLGFGFKYVLPAMSQHELDLKAKQKSAKIVDLSTASPEDLYKKPFDPVLIQKLNARGLDVFVDFTADWCISCHANEKIALDPKEVDDLFKQGKPVLLIGDYTHQDPMISAELAKYGRSGVPMYVLYKANGQTEVLPEVITKDLVMSAITRP